MPLYIKRFSQFPEKKNGVAMSNLNFGNNKEEIYIETSLTGL